MSDDDFPNSVQFFRGKSVVRSQRNRIDPEFADISVSPHMNVSRFIAVETVKEETERTGDARHGRHERVFRLDDGDEDHSITSQTRMPRVQTPAGEFVAERRSSSTSKLRMLRRGRITNDVA